MRNCPTCDAPIEEGQKSCPQCGCIIEEFNTVELICPVCRRKYPADSTFCIVDGAKLVTPDKLIPRCVICGTPYDDGTKFCPKDGGAVRSEASRYQYGPATPTGSPTGVRKGSLIRRFIAMILDGIFISLLGIPAGILGFLGFAKLADSFFSSSNHTIGIILLVVAFIFSFMPLVYTFIKDGLGNGQSWGKRIVGLRVIKIPDMTCCSKARSALRTLVTIVLDALVIGWLIEVLMVLLTSDGRRLADHAASTMVVNAEDTPCVNAAGGSNGANATGQNLRSSNNPGESDWRGPLILVVAVIAIALTIILLFSR